MDIRKLCVKSLYKLLISIEDDELNKDIAINIEQSIYSYCIDQSTKYNIIKKWTNDEFYDIYNNKYRELYINLNPKSYVKNDYLISEIKKKDFDLKSIAFMTPDKLFPSRGEKIRTELQERETILHQYKPKTTDVFKCGKCHERKCTTVDVNTRAADEPAITYVTCTVCGNNWKFSN
jgi:DNA-directed RNA polymerase subunit M/transcription elongation factor TFIIS